MAFGSWLAVSLALSVPAERAVAPLGPSHPAEGRLVDLVVRSPADLRAGAPTTLKLLLSDAATDAPVVGAKVALELFGAKGLGPIRGEATPGSQPGVYLFSTRFPALGRFAVVASVRTPGGNELLAAEGLEVGPALIHVSPGRSPLWVLLSGIAAALMVLGAFRLRRLPAAVALLLLLAGGDALAHGAFTPPPASVPGANVFVSQEIQFALGIRTAPATPEDFEPPGGGEASRTFIGIPRSAVVERDGHKLIFVRVGPERFVAREPKLGWPKVGDARGGGSRVAVLGGLGLDEKVVVEGAAFLRNGGAEPPAGAAANSDDRKLPR